MQWTSTLHVYPHATVSDLSDAYYNKEFIKPQLQHLKRSDGLLDEADVVPPLSKDCSDRVDGYFGAHELQYPSCSTAVVCCCWKSCVVSCRCQSGNPYKLEDAMVRCHGIEVLVEHLSIWIK